MLLGIGILAGAAFAQPHGLGAGITLGEPTGLSVAWRPDPWNAVQGGLGFDVVRGHFDGNVDYLRSVLVPQRTAEWLFPVYVGFGADLETVGRTDGGDRGGFGFRVPLGVAMHYDPLPTEVFFQAVPTIRVWPKTKFSGDVTLGGRFYF
jgi:hypothetical protein